MKDNISVEALIDRYISENVLTEGSLLPREEELAEKLQCDIKAISDALTDAEKKGKVKRQGQSQAVVLSSPVISDTEVFSFAKSAKEHGQLLVTKVLEAAVRPPHKDEDHPLSRIEQRAHQALGLREQAPFIVIARLRLLHEEPRALHRAYMNPDRFPNGFLNKHDFVTESLIHIYNQYGYQLTSRDTTLTARFPNMDERVELHIQMPSAVLEAEQKLFAIDPDTGEPFVLEFLQATYLKWRYEIKNRPAS